jgi:two-component system cell cycle sensor histidine kinase/response regulator CckA
LPGGAADCGATDKEQQRLLARYEAMLAAVPDIIVEVDHNKVYTWANQAALEFFGPDLLGKEAADYFTRPQDTYEKVQRLFRGDESVFYLESWQRRRDDEERLLAWWCRVLKDAEGNVVGALSTARDITERQQTEEALRRQLDELFAVFNGVDGAVYIADLETHEVLAANEHVERMYGADWRGKKCYTLLQEGQTGPCPFCTNARLIAADGTPAPPVIWEFQNTRTQRWYQCIDRAIRSPDGRLVRLEIAIDITERRRAEEEKTQLEAQLRRVQRMEAIGQVAGGVAHDFNNILTAIMGNVDMLRTELEQSGAVREEWVGHLDQIDRAAQRAAALTHQLLAFSRRQAVKREVLDLNQILVDMRPMLTQLISEDIALELVLGRDLACVRTDSSQVEQVILNLVVNARDAMPEGGRVVLETANVILDEEHLLAHPEACAGAHVLLTVHDTGCGMSPEVLEHSFEPFFTTKPLGQGTGLGLATVYGAVKQAGGHITVSSRPGCGTAFRVYWPAVETQLSAGASVRDDGRGRRGTETVLVCEDDGAVRDLAAHFLRSAGYTVLAAENGGHALELAAAYPDAIHLLVTDVIMPEVDGRHVADALTAARPALKTLFMSGYTSNIIAQHGVLDAGIELLEKPFTRARLLQCVRRLLDQPQTAAQPI